MSNEVLASLHDAVPEQAIRKLLYEIFGGSEWTIAKPAHGQQKECYLARSRDRTVFLKFDCDSSVMALLRLGELSVAPRVLAAGRERTSARPYVAWEYVAGNHPPEWRWFGENLSLLAQTARRYQTDPVLGRLLAKRLPAKRLPGGTATGYRAHLARELASLRVQYARLHTDERVGASLATDLARLLAELQQQAWELRPVSLAPVHGDPNPLNLIIPEGTRRSLLLVDWDGLVLSDPVSDLAQWLCWHVAREWWPLFFACYGLKMDRPLIDRMFWWAARASYANALWHLARRYPHEVFVRDCRDVLRRRMEPHQVFPGT